MRPATVLLLAIALDLVLGDPPNRWHPVAWMGAALERGRRALCAGSPRRLLLAGATLALLAVAGAAVAGAGVTALAGALGTAGIVVEAAALSTLLSLRGLVRAAGEVDASRTASPNAGWTMAAMAGALGVRLEKPGAYRLGDGTWPDVADVGRSARLMLIAAALFTLVCLPISVYFDR